MSTAIDSIYALRSHGGSPGACSLATCVTAVMQPSIVSAPLVVFLDQLNRAEYFGSDSTKLRSAFFAREDLSQVLLKVDDTLSTVNAKSFALMCAEFLFQR